VIVSSTVVVYCGVGVVECVAMVVLRRLVVTDIDVGWGCVLRSLHKGAGGILESLGRNNSPGNSLLAPWISKDTPKKIARGKLIPWCRLPRGHSHTITHKFQMSP
jgi:hypothetical protein